MQCGAARQPDVAAAAVGQPSTNAEPAEGPDGVATAEGQRAAAAKAVGPPDTNAEPAEGPGGGVATAEGHRAAAATAVRRPDTYAEPAEGLMELQQLKGSVLQRQRP